MKIIWDDHLRIEFLFSKVSSLFPFDKHRFPKGLSLHRDQRTNTYPIKKKTNKKTWRTIRRKKRCKPVQSSQMEAIERVSSLHASFESTRSPRFHGRVVRIVRYVRRGNDESFEDLRKFVAPATRKKKISIVRRARRGKKWYCRCSLVVHNR